MSDNVRNQIRPFVLWGSGCPWMVVHRNSPGNWPSSSPSNSHKPPKSELRNSQREFKFLHYSLCLSILLSIAFGSIRIPSDSIELTLPLLLIAGLCRLLKVALWLEQNNCEQCYLNSSIQIHKLFTNCLLPVEASRLFVCIRRIVYKWFGQMMLNSPGVRGSSPPRWRGWSRFGVQTGAVSSGGVYWCSVYPSDSTSSTSLTLSM